MQCLQCLLLPQLFPVSETVSRENLLWVRVEFESENSSRAKPSPGCFRVLEDLGGILQQPLLPLRHSSPCSFPQVSQNNFAFKEGLETSVCKSKDCLSIGPVSSSVDGRVLSGAVCLWKGCFALTPRYLLMHLHCASPDTFSYGSLT